MSKSDKAEKRDAIKAHKKAREDLETYTGGDGGPDDKKFWALNDKVIEAEKNVSWWRR